MTQTCCDMGNGTAYADDFICMHLQSATQWDALSHWNYDGKMYNGFPATSVLVTGTKRLGIEKMTGGVTGRGVLLDVAGLKGQKWLDTGYVITPADLEECEKRQQVRVGPGDILCFRTGWRTKFLEDGAATWMNGEPGLGLDCCEWLHSREVGAVCSDNWGIEAFPSEDPATIAPVHCVLLRDMGMPLGEIFDFEALADDCRKDGVWDFWFSAPPLKVTGGVGSPLNPIAVK
jgi:kynurenine formamidase